MDVLPHWTWRELLLRSMSDDNGILIRRWKSEGRWTAPETRTYEAETHLQQILSESPGWLPGVSAEAVTVRELSTAAGPVDVCAVDVSGTITIVECKLASNSERRRMVIGQVIDYAASIWREGEERFFDAWARLSNTDLSEWLSPEAFTNLRSNLRAGRFGLCLAVDAIDTDLRRLVEYLNRITLPAVSVTAIQLSYARDGEIEILIPKTFGAEIADAKLAPEERKARWTQESFLAALQDGEDRRTAEWLFHQTESTQLLGDEDPFWYGARPYGAIFLNPFGYKYGPVQLWVNKVGQLMIYGNWNQFSAVKAHPGFESLARLLGQDIHGGQRGVPVSTLDREQLWSAILTAARSVNVPAADDLGPVPTLD